MSAAVARAMPGTVSHPLKTALLIALIGPALTFVALPPALPQIALYFSGGLAGQRIAQQMQTLPFLGLAVGGLLAGWLINLLGPRRLLWVAALGYALSATVGLLARTPGPLLLACAVLGLMGSLITSTLVAVAGSVLSPDARTRMLGFQTAISDLSTVLGAIVGAILAQHYGWHAPFCMYLAFGVTMWALAASVPARLAAEKTGGWVEWRTLLGHLWPTYAAAIGIFMLVGTQTTQLPFYLAARGFDTPSVRALVLTSSTLAAMVGAILYAIATAASGPLLCVSAH